jgi:hypothetical protein
MIFDGTPPLLCALFLNSGCNVKDTPVVGTDGGFPDNLCQYDKCVPAMDADGRLHGLSKSFSLFESSSCSQMAKSATSLSLILLVLIRNIFYY